MRTMSRPIAIILGAGPGLGAALARSLSSTHSLLLLSRSLPSSLPRLGKEITSLPHDRLLACPSDGTRASIDSALKEMRAKWGDDARVDVGIYNVGGYFNVGDFLNMGEEELMHGLNNGVYV
jgi:NAD(P)-dependent dehydrogenase (short-subunit alcohol dehydrogenase family)